MKKYVFFIFFLCLLICSCDNYEDIDFSLCHYRVVNIDGHDYIAYKSGYGLGFCHSESCKNPNHYGD